ncbi:hypothetical protein MCL88_16845, partial [Acinetobacter baumannii]|nr:hypothetical protein [Acinetobacter baumannii]
KKSEYYPLPAGLHCQSTLTGRIAKEHEKVITFLWESLRAPSAAEREGDTFGCAGFFGSSLLTLFRFATII